VPGCPAGKSYFKALVGEFMHQQPTRDEQSEGKATSSRSEVHRQREATNIQMAGL